MQSPQRTEMKTGSRYRRTEENCGILHEEHFRHPEAKENLTRTSGKCHSLYHLVGNFQLMQLIMFQAAFQRAHAEQVIAFFRRLHTGQLDAEQ